MSRSNKQLEALEELLSRSGSDPERLSAVRQTQAFRRSWVDLAKCLHEIRKKNAHSKWGFSDFHSYCLKELTLKRPTVDKLLISFSTLSRYAPRVLERDGVAAALPSLDSVSYLAKAVDQHGSSEGAANQGESQPPALEALSKAVFEEQRPLRDIKREFNPLLFPPKGEANPKKRAQKSLSAIRKLKDELLELDMLSPAIRTRLDNQLSLAQEELQLWLDEASQKKASPKAADPV